MSAPQTPPPVKSSDEYFNSTRLRVIGMITAATVAVGALGGIAGVAFDPDPVPKDNVIQPGGDNARLAPQSLGSPGNSTPRGKAVVKLPQVSRVSGVKLPSADDTPSSLPSSVGSVSPGGGGLVDDGSSDAPTDQPTDGTSGSTSCDGGQACGVTLESTGVDVYVPPNWSVDATDDSTMAMSDGNGSFAFAFSFAADPSAAAGDVITQNLDGLLPPENYTQLQTSDVQALDPFGSVVSLAGIEYEALWVDNQGSVSIHGQIYVGVRQDGTVLGILIEHVPAEDFQTVFNDLTPILDNSFNRFGGLD